MTKVKTQKKQKRKQRQKAPVGTALTKNREKQLSVRKRAKPQTPKRVHKNQPKELRPQTPARNPTVTTTRCGRSRSKNKVRTNICLLQAMMRSAKSNLLISPKKRGKVSHGTTSYKQKKKKTAQQPKKDRWEKRGMQEILSTAAAPPRTPARALQGGYAMTKGPIPTVGYQRKRQQSPPRLRKKSAKSNK